METLLLDSSENDLVTAASLIRQGHLVGIPTETVYGLGADAGNERAVRSIFEAKGRPSDNPLIVHLADFSQAKDYTTSIPQLAYTLAEHFCPGPLTMVLPKNERIPMATSGGLDTVGIRVPSHPVMHRIIELAGCPIAAPSANTSGYPSPTSAQHVLADMNGRIAAIVDGGVSEFGVESTVISFDDDRSVRILRPGCITKDMLLEYCQSVTIDPAILKGLADGEKAASPGMKYKHYSPEAHVVMVEGSAGQMREFARKNASDSTYFVIYSGDEENFPGKYITYGADSLQQAHSLFAILRDLDSLGAEKVYVRAPAHDGVGLAVYNRLIRAAGFEVIAL